MKFIIVCGGQGTKIWPYSTVDKPKQFQPILGDTSLFKHNVDILLSEYSPKDIYIATKEKYLKYVAEQTPDIPKENYLVEPDIAKNRGPAEGLAVYRLSIQFPDETFMIVQSDCVREPSDKYLVLVKEMIRVAEETGKLVTGGITVDRPIIGIDYLALGESLQSRSGLAINTIDKFLYRPQTIKEIEHLLEGSGIVTHSNHMTWNVNEFKKAYKKYKPDWHQALEKMCETINNSDHEKADKIYSGMEKAATEVVSMRVMDSGGAINITLPYKWSDIGSWDSLQSYFAGKGQNYVDGKGLVIDSDNIIAKAGKKKVIAVFGMKDTVIVDTDDALLVMDRDKCADVGIILDELKNRGLDEYL